MGKALADAFPICRETFDEADAALGEPLSRLVLRGARGSADADREHAAGDSRRQHRRVPAARVARAHARVRRRPQPRRVLGQRRGRHASLRRRAADRAAPRPLHAGGGAGRRRARWRRSSASTPSRSRRRARRPREGEVVSPANLNGAGQVVIAGARDAVARAGERAKALGAKRVVPLPVSAPFHCALMKPAEERLAPELRALAVARPARAGRRQRRRRAEARRARRRSRRSSRRCRRRSAGKRSSRRLASEGVTTYVEVGPGTVLSGLVRKIHREATVVSFGSSGRSGAVEALVEATRRRSDLRRCSICQAKWRS